MGWFEALWIVLAPAAAFIFGLSRSQKNDEHERDNILMGSLD